ncbi:MAG TPA: hypothetical protein PKA64_20145, partial [Myxococcota bacterium]|nr:hypothetical protein [Myxococcota bacterium]
SAALGGGPASRSRVKVGRECLVDEEALPPIDVGLWGPGWYGGWDASSEATVVVGGRPIVERRARSGPDLEGAAWGACPRGVAPVAGGLDEDGDGSGVSGVDRWGVLGGRRFFCGPLPEGYARSGGDCDDLDPAWSPDSVRLAPGSDCLGVLPDDLDADGTISLFDPDDRDGSVR